MSARVLLVGQDASLMEHIAFQVSMNGLEAQWAGDPREALAMAEEADVDVVVLNLKDLMEDGIILLRSLKRRLPVVEVITLSMPSSIRYSIAGMKLGAFSDLLMPFDLEELVSRIREALEHKARKARSLRQRLEDLAAGVAFAEAAEFETARDLARKREKLGPKGEDE